MVVAVKELKILSALSWPMRLQREFLERWHKGRAKLPQPEYPKLDLASVREVLDRITVEAQGDHPLARYVRETAQAWVTATWLLEHMGEIGFTEFSTLLYGRPGDRIAGSEVHNTEAARHFIDVADELMHDPRMAEAEFVIDAETVKREMEARLDAVFTQHKIKVVVDPDLVAKAAAGPTRVRLRAQTGFSEYDLHQLLEHEAFVHSLTALNGREQPHFRSLGLNSPRITATQEGLAVFAELATGSIDIARMKRISLRILAIDQALKGADFLDVFRFFLETGQSETDSFNSAMRVFRGAPLGGGDAFTKDTVYLHGLLSVHTFFRWAMREKKLHLARYLFAGKMTLQDAMAFEPCFEDGSLAPPLYLPPWMRRSHGLAGYLAFSLFVNRIRLDRIEQEDLHPGGWG